jgi:hypothetical protein
MAITPFLSIIVTSRNDNHGGNLLRRMQTFLDCLASQSTRHKIPIELIIVEWNPPSEAPSLEKALNWVAIKKTSFTSVRIVSVPRNFHTKLPNSDKLPLFQMLAKNIGIRRAKGKYILATNVDVIFGNEIFNFIKNKLDKNILYRVDRFDIPAYPPSNASFNEILKYCNDNFYRIYSAGKIFTKVKGRWRKRDLLTLLSPLFIRPALLIFPFFSNNSHTIQETARSPIKTKATFIEKMKSYAEKILNFSFRYLNLNASGDFMLLDRVSWFRLRGYPEWPIFSMHLDSIFMYQAKISGIPQKNLGRKFPIFHIDHAGGWAPETNDLLYLNLTQSQISHITSNEFKKIVGHQRVLKQSNEFVFYNSENWGMSEIHFSEITIK